MDIKKIKKQALKEIKKAKTLKEINDIYKKYLNKEGRLNLILKSLKTLPIKKRRRIGKETNSLKEIFKKEKEIEKELFKKELEKSKIDISQPGKKIERGHLHPLTQVFKEAGEIFQSMGFEIVEGPEIETEWYNFDALNIGPDHPARDTLSLGKTYFIEKNRVLRTQTSAVQVRYMEKHQPPFKIIVPGRVYRYEATDASHEFQLHQIEGLMVDKRGKISVANFKAVIEEFLKRFFKKKIEIRLRPSYFPFTEPSFEVDVSCPICNKKGCSVCKNGWIEIMGAGMVHQKVFENSGFALGELSGFAFGVGADRLAMIKYKINDIRLFHSGDLRFLTQF
jgi:phenylalanyl-tRNA synthetase alpha chain